LFLLLPQQQNEIFKKNLSKKKRERGKREKEREREITRRAGFPILSKQKKDRTSFRTR